MIEKVASRTGPETVRESSTPRSARGVAPSAAIAGRSFSEVLERIGVQVDRGEALVRRAFAGGHSGLDAGDLIALQAGIYRYTEAVDLAAKLIDRASSAVKTTLQGSGG